MMSVVCLSAWLQCAAQGSTTNGDICAAFHVDVGLGGFLVQQQLAEVAVCEHDHRCYSGQAQKCRWVQAAPLAALTR